MPRIVWVRTTEDPCETIVPVGKRWANKEVTLRVPEHLILSRRIPGPVTDAHAMLTPDFVPVHDGDTILLNEKGCLQVYTELRFVEDIDLLICRNGRTLKTISFRGVDRFVAVLAHETPDGFVSVPRSGSSEPVHLRLFDESEPPRPVAGLLVEVRAITNSFTLIDARTGAATRHLSGETNEEGFLRTFRVALTQQDTTSTSAHLLVRAMSGGFDGIPVGIPIEPRMEPAVVIRLPPAEPDHKDLSSFVGPAPHSRPFDMTPPPRWSIPTGWMVAALILMLGIGMAVFGEVVTGKGPLSTAKASMTDGPQAAVLKKPESIQVVPPPRALYAEAGDVQDIRSVCAQRDPMHWCSSWIVSDTSVEFRDCAKLEEDRACTCPGTSTESSFTYTIARCRKTRVP